MKIDKENKVVQTETGESIDQLKEEMFNLKEELNDTIFGIFNGNPFICEVSCNNLNEIRMMGDI